MTNPTPNPVSVLRDIMRDDYLSDTNRARARAALAATDNADVQAGIDLRNVTVLDRSSDMSVTVRFASCRAASQFANEIESQLMKVPAQPEAKAEQDEASVWRELNEQKAAIRALVASSQSSKQYGPLAYAQANADASRPSAPIEAGELPEFPELPKPLKTTDRGTPLFFVGQMLDFARAYGQLCRANKPESVTGAPGMPRIISETDEAGKPLTTTAYTLCTCDGKFTTKPASTSSVGDDAEFDALICRYRASTAATAKSFKAKVIAYIDARQPVAPDSGREAAIRNAALEEAAKLVEDMVLDNIDVAASIRELKSAPGALTVRPIASFEGYVDGKPRIKWLGEPMPAGTEFFAATGGGALTGKTGEGE